MLSNTDINNLRSIGIEQVAEACNLTVKKHKTLCPFHSDTRPSLTFNVKKNFYRCFVCDAKGGPIDLVMHMMNLSFYDACHWLAKTFNITLDETLDLRHSSLDLNRITPRKVKPAHSTEVRQSTVDVRHLSLLMAQPYLCPEAKKFLFDERKIKPEVVEKLGLSSISSPVPMSGDLNGSWFNAPSLLIPYKDIDGNLISVQARYLGKKEFMDNSRAIHDNSRSQEKPRFQFPKGSVCGIFNLPILKTLKPGDALFVTEGVSDCLAMLSAGFPSLAIPSATLLKPSDAKFLKKFHLHIYPDRDKPGERLFLDLQEINPNITRHQLPEGFKDVGQYYAYLHREDALNPLTTFKPIQQ